MKFQVEGPQILNGSVTVSGAKNSATRVLAAALLSDGNVTLRNFPLNLEDVQAKMKFIQAMGADLEQNHEESVLKLSVSELSFKSIQDFDLPIRTTYLLAAGTLAREGEANIPYPGGCKIGSRGYDLHIVVWEKLGCKVTEKADYIEVIGEPIGGIIDFPISTVGGTENAILCGVIAKGETLIRNAYVTPEVHDLIKFLREMGAHIYLEGTSHIRIQGEGGLLGSASFSIMSDRIEALTWIVLAAITKGSVLIHNVPLETMKVPLVHLRDSGLDIFTNSNSVMVTPDCIGPYGLQPFELATGTHPGVISDMQPFFTTLALFANGRSIIFDYRYPERIAYAHELAKFAPDSIEATTGKITVTKAPTLQGALVKSTDLRGSMAQIMAAICARDKSQVEGVELALRGYNNLPQKLEKLGVEAKWWN